MTHVDDQFREGADLTDTQGSSGSGGSSSGGNQAATLTPSRELKEGDIVGDRYRVVSFIGRGAMGSVYKVEHLLLKKHFALKTLSTVSTSSTVFRRFKNEAEAASKLDHPNLVRAIDFGLIDGEQPYFVMDLIRGRNLSRHLKKNGKLTIEQALEIFIPICQAVDYAHEFGIVHRDIKPSNIVLESGHGGKSNFIPKVVDFGIAKIEDDGQGLTKTGEIFGTPMYMSPEQCLGASVDKRSDVYSLGCVLYEALTGASPFKGSTALETMMMHRAGEPLSLKEASLGCQFPADLEKVVAKMLAKDPAHRYQRCSDTAVDLERLAAGERIVGAVDLKDGLSKQGQKQDSKRKRKSAKFWLLSIVLPVILLGATVASIIMQSNLRPKSNVAQAPPANVDARQKPVAAPTVLPSSDSISAGQSAQKEDSDDQKNDSLFSGIQSLTDSNGQGLSLSTLLASQRDLKDISISTLRSGGQVNDEEMKAFKDRTDIESLNLNRQTHLTDQCLKYITHLPLRRLCLQNTRIDNNGLKEIAKLHSLGELDLSHTRISPSALSYLIDLKHLSMITLSNQAANDDGLANLSLIPSLQWIEMKHGEFTEKGLLKLSALNDLNSLTLLSDGTISGLALQAIGQLKALSTLSLQGTALTDESSLKNLDRLPLTNLNLSNTKITNAGLKYLSGIHSLRELDLSDNDITNGALESISKLPLSKLILSKTRLTKDGSLSALSKCQIVSLDLSGTDIDGSALDSVAAMKNLKVVTIAHCKFLTQKDLSSLKEKVPELSIGY